MELHAGRAAAGHRRLARLGSLLVASLLALLAKSPVVAQRGSFPLYRSFDGRGNSRLHPEWG
jgi:hypothetical protein